MHRLIAVAILLYAAPAACAGSESSNVKQAETAAAAPPALTSVDSAQVIVSSLLFHDSIFARTIYAALCDVSPAVLAHADSIRAALQHSRLVLQSVCFHNENPNSKRGSDSIALTAFTVTGDSIHISWDVVAPNSTVWSERISYRRGEV